MTIQFSNISKSFNGITIFENISGKINKGDRIGLIGINGIGKTTLLRILSGSEDKDSGSTTYSPENIILHYFEQNWQFSSEQTVYQEIYESFSEEIYPIDMINTQTKSLLFNIGFSEKDFYKKISQLSGGEKTKLFLSKALSKRTDILLLDEPTNHLDINTVKWLEKFLKKLHVTIIIASHDRLFLDNTVNKIFEMNKNSLKEYPGNYSDFRHQREHEISTLNKRFERENREINHLKEIITQRNQWFQYTQSKSSGGVDYRNWKDKSGVQARIIQSKRIKLMKLEENRVEKPKDESINIFDIVNKRFKERRLPKYLIEVKNLKKNYDDNILFKNVSLQIKSSDKIAIIGDNGSGKTTLLKILLGKEKASEGSVYITPSLKIGYFSQELEGLCFKNTLLEELQLEGVSKQNAFAMLFTLLFKKEDIDKKIQFFSMGEKCRIALGKLILSAPDLLVLDEPTNFMDIASRENFETVVSQFLGTIILVTHDRYFINKFANRIFEIEKCEIKAYEGNYKYYLSRKIMEKKEQAIGNSYHKASDDIMVLECRLASLSRALGEAHLKEEEKAKITDEFFSVSKQIKMLKEQIK
jgi:ATP-binding cassette, subfamily F, member 3